VTELYYLFAVSAALACMLAAIGIWSHQRVRPKVTALALAAFFLPSVYLSYVDLLSRPKPASLEWWRRHADEATVLGSKLREGENIYLWLQISGTQEPRAYVLPWQQELAKQLYGAQREAESNGTRVRMRTPFRNTPNEQERVFYAEPQPALPPKHVPENGAYRFRHSSSEIPERNI